MIKVQEKKNWFDLELNIKCSLNDKFISTFIWSAPLFVGDSNFSNVGNHNCEHCSGGKG